MISYTGHIAGQLNLRPGDDASGVTEVGGSVWVYPGAHIELPACESVGGGVYAEDGARVELPVCESVGGNIWVFRGAHVDLGACRSVGGSVVANERARIWLPSCPRDAIAGVVFIYVGARVVIMGETVDG